MPNISHYMQTIAVDKIEIGTWYLCNRSCKIERITRKYLEKGPMGRQPDGYMGSRSHLLLVVF